MCSEEIHSLNSCDEAHHHNLRVPNSRRKKVRLHYKGPLKHLQGQSQLKAQQFSPLQILKGYYMLCLTPLHAHCP